MVLTLGILILTDAVTVGILDQETKVYGNHLLLPTGNGILGGTNSNARHIRGSLSHNTVDFALVVVDDHAAGSFRGLTLAVGILLTIQNHVAERFSHQLGVLSVVSRVVPAQRAVGSSHDVTVPISLGIGGVGGDRLNTVVTGSGNHLLVTGNDLGVGIVQINLQHVGHLTEGTGLVVQDDLRFLNTGSQFPVSLGDQLIVIVSGRGVVEINACSQSGQGHHTEHHDGSDQKSQYTGEFFHAYFSFSFFGHRQTPIARKGAGRLEDKKFFADSLEADNRKTRVQRLLHP